MLLTIYPLILIFRSGQQDNVIINDQLCGVKEYSQGQIRHWRSKALHQLIGLLDDKMSQKMRKKANRFEGIKEVSNVTNAIKRARTKTFVKEDYDD